MYEFLDKRSCSLNTEEYEAIQRFIYTWFHDQPERSKREDCEKGIHSHKGFIKENPDQWKCDYCDAIIRRCGALNSMET